jgi:hypothetical protein
MTVAVCRDCGSEEWAAEDAECEPDITFDSRGRPIVDVEIVTGGSVRCVECGSNAEDSAVGRDQYVPTGGRALQESAEAQEMVVGLDVWTTDHVRRRVVSWGLDPYGCEAWTDEDGVTNAPEQIDSVIHGGQSMSVQHFIEAKRQVRS